MKITVCIGSSCHVKGSRKVVEQLQQLVKEKQLDRVIDLSGAFCIGDCTSGVCVMVDEEKFSVHPEDTKLFFENDVLRRLDNGLSSALNG